MHIASIIAAWSHIEYLLGFLFAFLLDADAEVGTSIYISIISPQAKIAALDAIANQRLTPEGIKQLNVVKSTVRTAQKYRNEVVHGIWTVSDQEPDALVLCSTREAVQSVAKNLALRRKRIRPLNTYSAMRHNEPDYKLYRTKDFIAIEQGIQNAANEVQDFIERVRPKSPLAQHESNLVTAALNRLHPRTGRGRQN